MFCVPYAFFNFGYSRLAKYGSLLLLDHSEVVHLVSEYILKKIARSMAPEHHWTKGHAVLPIRLADNVSCI
jgi:hypothetical protein